MTASTTHVAEGLFEVRGDDVALVGSRCETCGSHYFPQALGCRNPACDATAVARVLLGRRGRLHSYTVQHYQPPALFRMSPWAPYAIGLVELDEGPRLMTNVIGCPPASVSVGMRVRVTWEPLSDGRNLPQFEPA